MRAPYVILRTPWGGPWRAYSNPTAVFETRDAAGVRKCLEDVDAAVRASGLHAAGFVAYEAAAAFDLPVFPARGSSLPLVWFGLFRDDQSIDAPFIPGVRPHGVGSDPITRGLTPGAGEYHVGGWQPTVARDAYRRAIREIRTRIEAGDTYQINYTWRLTSRVEGDPLSLFVDLDRAQRGSWSAYVDIGTHAICSASPELFFALADGRIECRPMKGTARRGLSADDDRVRGEALRASAKNRAENVMVVDMTRNDLGRVAAIGSVHVPVLFEVERYPGQWQMASTVVAEVGQARLPDLFAALFPSGSVTGAPKRSSMGIIRGLEGSPRGIYTGAIGVFGGRRAHFNVAIRTVEIDRARGSACFGVGSGIVWDSVEQDEYDECLVKASILTARQPSFELLETMRWVPGEGFARLEGHIARLLASAEYFQFARITVDEIRQTVAGAVRGCTSPQRVRLLASRDGHLRCEATALTGRRDPIRVALAADPIDAANVFLYHKTTMRGLYEDALKFRPGADSVLLWNTEGELTEATDANLVLEIDGRRVTPPVACGLLPGVERASLLASGAIVEAYVRVDDLHRTEALWLINSVRGWMRAEWLHSPSRSL